MYNDVAIEREIRKYLSEKSANVKFEIRQQIGSTNDEMKKKALEGEEEISVLIAESQTRGKGRKGRSFFSPQNTGIYMSFLLRPKYTPEECTLLTTMAAAATAEAIERVTKKQTQIKWINDIFINGRKVAGILTEGAIAPDLKAMEWAVVGIGINLMPPKEGFPEEIENTAGSVLSGREKALKNRLIAEVINIVSENYQQLSQKKYMQSYRSRLFFLGEEITVIEADNFYRATALTVDDMCHLIVKLSDGSEKVLIGGEISIRA